MNDIDQSQHWGPNDFISGSFVNSWFLKFKLEFLNSKYFLFRYTYLFDFAGGNVLSVLVGHTTFNINTGGIIFEELIIFQRKRTFYGWTTSLLLQPALSLKFSTVPWPFSSLILAREYFDSTVDAIIAKNNDGKQRKRIWKRKLIMVMTKRYHFVFSSSATWRNESTWYEHMCVGGFQQSG